MRYSPNSSGRDLPFGSMTLPLGKPEKVYTFPVFNLDAVWYPRATQVKQFAFLMFGGESGDY